MENHLIKSYYIFASYQQGNIAPLNFRKIKNQPREGFDSRRLAETYLRESEEIKHGRFYILEEIKIYNE
jgi:hypothetical protein